MLTDAVGYAAMVCASLIHVPQLVHTYRTKSAGDISWGFVASNVVVCSLSGMYGFLINHMPIYTANMVCLFNTGVLGVMKYKYTPISGGDDCADDGARGSVPTGEPPDDDRFY